MVGTFVRMINKVIHDKGGLYHRLTGRIYLAPFTLHECELYSEALGLAMNIESAAILQYLIRYLFPNLLKIDRFGKELIELALDVLEKEGGNKQGPSCSVQKERVKSPPEVFLPGDLCCSAARIRTMKWRNPYFAAEVCYTSQFFFVIMQSWP